MNNCQVCGKEIITSPFHNEVICNDCEIWAHEAQHGVNFITKEALGYLDKLFKEVNNQLEVVNLCRVVSEKAKPKTNYQLNSILRMRHVIDKASGNIHALVR